MLSFHATASNDFSASLTRISPDMSFGSRVSRIVARVRNSKIFNMIFSINGEKFLLNT